MTQHFSLSWTIGVGSDCQGGNQLNPAWRDIENRLDQARAQCGSVNLDIRDSVETGPQSLQVQCDRGNFLMALGDVQEGSYEVRSFTNAGADAGGIEILGNSWDSKMVCSDFTLVRVSHRL